MSEVIHMQMTLPTDVSTVFEALTDRTALEAWFAERASVSLAEKRYDLWGRFTPGMPTEAGGQRVIEHVERDKRLRLRWRFREADTTVEWRLKPSGAETILAVWHRDVPTIPPREPGWYGMTDVWFMFLENLRRYLIAEPIVRCDFTTIRGGDVTHTIEINAPGDRVWDALVKPEHRNRWITSDAASELAVGDNWTEWGEHGSLKVLEIQDGERLTLEWEIAGIPTVVTWSLEESGGRTRLTLAHSGFAPDFRTDGEFLGWLQYLSWIQSLVEQGFEWLPPIKEIAKNVALYYAAEIWARQDELIADEVWEEE